jgi:hemolysin activation/secretion protein
LLTLGERIDGQFMANGGALGYNVGINIPVTARDARMSFRYSDTYSTIVEAPLDALNITSHIVGFDAGISQPLYRHFANDLTVGLNMVVRENRTLLADNCVPLSGVGIETCDTQVSVLRMSQHLSHKGEHNGLVFWSTFNLGLNMLGATTNKPGLQSGEFFSWLGQSLFSTRLLENGTALVVKANIQLADSPLLNLERYSVGGGYTVRGYRENTYVRDNGFNFSAEIKYPVYADAAEKDSLSLVPFLDYGGAWDNPTLSNTQPHSHYLYSAGIGFNWQYQRLSADFYWAHAFTPVQNRSVTSHSIQDDGIHFRVNMNVF